MNKKFYLDRDGVRYSVMIDPEKGVITFSPEAQSFLNDIGYIVRTGMGFGAIEGVKDNNRYVVSRTKGSSQTFVNVIADLLGLIKCGRGVEGMFYSVPEALDIDAFYDKTSYGGMVNYLLSTNLDYLKDMGVDVDLLDVIAPCLLCEKLVAIKDKYSGVKVRLALTENNYGDKDNWLYVGKEAPIKISYCPKCGRKLPESE